MDGYMNGWVMDGYVNGWMISREIETKRDQVHCQYSPLGCLLVSWVTLRLACKPPFVDEETEARARK